MAVRVVFEGPEGAVDASAEVGERLMDVADEHVAPVPFSCRAATCGTCRMQIVEGWTHLAPAEDDEREVLEALGAAPHQRLTCQARVTSEGGTIRLRSAAGISEDRR